MRHFNFVVEAQDTQHPVLPIFPSQQHLPTSSGTSEEYCYFPGDDGSYLLAPSDWGAYSQGLDVAVNAPWSGIDTLDTSDTLTRDYVPFQSESTNDSDPPTPRALLTARTYSSQSSKSSETLRSTTNFHGSSDTRITAKKERRKEQNRHA